MLAALDAADAAIPRAEALAGGRDERHRWSNAFADACASMIAGELRMRSELSRLMVLPSADGPSEPRTFAAGDKQKQVDVVVSSTVAGLQIGISLKAMNFRDANGGQFDKNLTGRTYELQDELRVIHEYQPASLLIALYFLPLAATDDKRSNSSPSSFARTVEHLRSRTGRVDRFLPSQLAKADMAAVALYVPGDHESARDGLPAYNDAYRRGIVRLFDVMVDPPKRGRPIVGTTLSIDSWIDLVVRRYLAGDGVPMSWVDAEEP